MIIYYIFDIQEIFKKKPSINSKIYGFDKKD